MGYIGQSRSVRSLEAINSGLLTKKDLKAWQKRAVKQGGVTYKEWHHTGKFYNKTYYYDPLDFEDLDPKDYPISKNKVKESQKKYYVLVSAEWGGTRKHPKIIGADVKVVDKLRANQEQANKYNFYGGYIKEFDNKQQAEEFAKYAELMD